MDLTYLFLSEEFPPRLPHYPDDSLGTQTSSVTPPQEAHSSSDSVVCLLTVKEKTFFIQGAVDSTFYALISPRNFISY